MAKSKLNRSKIDPSNIVKLQGTDHVTYDGLLDLAHREGLIQISSRLVQAPGPENNQTAICEATAVFEVEGVVKTFSDIGDANPTNVSRGILPHIIRMASTRAKGRCLRDGLNIDGCTADELADYEPHIREDGAPKRQTSAPQERPPMAAREGSGVAPRDFPREEVGAGHTWAPNEPQTKRIFAIAKSLDLQASDVKRLMAANKIGIGPDGEPHTTLIDSKAAYDHLCNVLIPEAASAA